MDDGRAVGRLEQRQERLGRRGRPEQAEFDDLLVDLQVDLFEGPPLDHQVVVDERVDGLALLGDRRGDPGELVDVRRRSDVAADVATAVVDGVGFDEVATSARRRTPALFTRPSMVPRRSLPAKMDRGSKQARNSASRVGKETSLRGSEQAGSADP
jgi:hypothetical protein